MTWHEWDAAVETWLSSQHALGAATADGGDGILAAAEHESQQARMVWAVPLVAQRRAHPQDAEAIDDLALGLHALATSAWIAGVAGAPDTAPPPEWRTTARALWRTWTPTTTTGATA